MSHTIQTIAILHSIRSAQNVGSVFRTADAAGVSRIYLAGYTPAPVDRFGRKRADIAKTALGAEETVGWEQVDDIYTLIGELKAEGVTIVAVEQHSKAVDCREVNTAEPTAFIFGNEVDGLPEDVLRASGLIVQLPMRGRKESLNVAVAAGIVLYMRVFFNSKTRR